MDDRQVLARDMGQGKTPLLSVILATPVGYGTIRKTVSHLRSQTARLSLELVVVAPSKALLGLEVDQLNEFAGFQVVEIKRFQSIGQANAAGIRQAVAPIVALAEDHCFPDPQWAENLISAHQGPWAAVGPGVRNANPNTAVSWADLFIGYGPWLTPAPSREAEFLPGHNTSYKREILLGYGDQLDAMMEAETVLHWDLREKGHRLHMESTASVAHTNFSLWSSWVPAQFYNGRLFAGARARQKPLSWRIMFALGSPLIPIVRLWRIWAGLPSQGLKIQFLSCLHALMTGLAIDGMGQMVGYALGTGNALDKVARFEVDRFKHIREQDRLEILGF
ncbi:MAG: glycosyltransferase [Nitrospirales bacterium]